MSTYALRLLIELSDSQYSHDNDHDSSSTFLNDVNDFVIVRIVYSFNISFQIVTVLSSPVTVSSI